MKKYLLMALLASLSIQAEDNPFALKENLQKIDKDQDVLLSALKEISDDQEAKEDAVLDEQEVNEAPVAEVNTEEPQVQEEIVMDKEQSEVSPDNVDIVSAKLMDKETEKSGAQKKQAIKNEADTKAEEMAQQKKEEARLAKIKEQQAKIEAQREQELAQEREAQVQKEKALVQKEKEEAQKREQERLEVEAYEKKRAVKKEMDAKVIETEVKTQGNTMDDNAIADINITREQMIAKKEADKAYLEAVAEMDVED